MITPKHFPLFNVPVGQGFAFGLNNLIIKQIHLQFESFESSESFESNESNEFHDSHEFRQQIRVN